MFGGVGKTERELDEALDAGVLLINVESEPELARSIAVGGEAAWRDGARRAARESGGHGRHAARVHPDRREGEQVRHSVRRGAVGRASRARRCRTSSCSASTCTSARSSRSSSPTKRRSSGCCSLPTRARARRRMATLEYLDIGGGLAVTYDAERAVDVAHFGEVIGRTRWRRLDSRSSWSRAASSSATRRAADARPVPKAQRRKGVRHHRRGNDRAAAPVALRRVSPHRGGAAQRADDRRGRRGPGVRERRLSRARPRDRRRRSPAIFLLFSRRAPTAT